jgi:hypothetical protein
MREYEFTIILATAEECEQDANALYEAGCADGSISTSGCVRRTDCLYSESVVPWIGRRFSADVRNAFNRGLACYAD